MPLDDMPFGDRERAILGVEAQWNRHAGAKEEAIRAQLGLSPARYYQLLGRLIETTAAQQYDPLLVKRLRRRRDERHDARLTRATGNTDEAVERAAHGSSVGGGYDR